MVPTAAGQTALDPIENEGPYQGAAEDAERSADAPVTSFSYLDLADSFQRQVPHLVTAQEGQGVATDGHQLTAHVVASPLIEMHADEIARNPATPYTAMIRKT
jgi:hypothetical protein